MCTITKNESYNSFELSFDGKPSEEIRNLLKANGYRWHGKRGIWYGYKDISTLLNVEQTAPEQTEQTKPHTAKKQLATLWERTRTDSLPAYGTDNDLKKTARESGEAYDKAAAAIMRKHLRERFPECNISVRIDKCTYIYCVDITIKSSPYSLNLVKGDPSAIDYGDRYDHKEPSEELAAILKYCEALHNAFDADDGDHYADYGAHHDLYGSVSIDYHYTQTEPTAEQLADAEAFKVAKAQDEEQQRIAEQQRREEEKRRYEQEAKEAAERKKQAEADAALILEHVEVEDLPEDRRTVILNCACGIGGENSLAEVYKNTEPTDESGNPNKKVHYEDLEIWRTVKFTSMELFGKFCKMFIRDWEFCAGMGGTGTEDCRLAELGGWDGYSRLLNSEQRKTIHTFGTECIGVYLNNVLQFVIDPQGRSYCCYVYVPTLQEDGEVNAKDYRKQWREKSEQLSPFYIPATLVEQIESANLEPGEQVTILRIDGFLYMEQTTKGKLIEAKAITYAQYNDAAKFTLIPNGKRKESQIITHKGNDFVLYRGDLPELPQSLLYTPTNNPIMFEVNYAGMGSEDFIKKAIAYYAGLGYSPIINTIPS